MDSSPSKTGLASPRPRGGSLGGTDRPAPVRLLILHHRTASLPYSAAEMEACREHVRTAVYGAETLKLVLHENFDVFALQVGIHSVEAAAFAGEVRRLCPWIRSIILTPHDTMLPGVEPLFAGVDRMLPATSSLSEVCSAAREVAGGVIIPAEEEEGATALVAAMAPALSKSLRAATVAGALREIADASLACLRHDLVAVMGTEEESVIAISARGTVPQSLAAAIETEVADRYAVMGGRSVDRNYLRREFTQLTQDSAGKDSFARAISVPIVLDGSVVGVFCAVDLDSAAQPTRREMRNVAIAAEHASVVLSALHSLRSLASRDALTGVLNRMGIEDALERAWVSGRRQGLSTAVAVLDIDRFKEINDSYGHSVGDQVLQEFSSVLREVIRGSDAVGRYGGDEFVAVLSDADESAARAFSRRLIRATRERTFCRQTHKLKMTISVGISTSNAPVRPATSDDLLTQADRALYVAKREGRNRMCVWPESFDAVDGPPAGQTEKADSPRPALTRHHAGRIMVVDDEDMVRTAVGDILRHAGHDVDLFDSAESALEAMSNAPRETYAVVLTDLKMPNKSGIELLQEMAALDESVVKIVITGYATVHNAVSSLREGAYDFIQKPVRPAQMQAVVDRALDYRRLRMENRRYQEHLEDLVRERSAQLASTLEEVRSSHEFTLEALVAMLDARENQTGRHSIRVRSLAVALGEKMGLPEDELKVLSHAALLHDIGKISVSDAILLKPGPLLPEEWEIMRRHPEAGFRILKSSSYLKEAAEIVLSHHERYDGLGYPRRLKGNDICLGARVFSVADAYEAMRSQRVYRPPLPPEIASGEIAKSGGTQFDPQVTEIFLKHVEEFERILAS
ncbi:MAG: diguanylate cyclase [Lentisphaerae bacterium]|nr:diguanylate cyclase [Lentisphaerota bacterium]